MSRHAFDSAEVVAASLTDQFTSLGELDPAVALSLWHSLSKVVQALPFPRLIVGKVDINTGGVTTKETDPEDIEDALWCPYCDRPTGVIAVDWAVRNGAEAESYDFDFEGKSVGMNYDSDADFEGLNYECNSCGKPVRLPEGWTKE